MCIAVNVIIFIPTDNMIGGVVRSHRMLMYAAADAETQLFPCRVVQQLAGYPQQRDVHDRVNNGYSVISGFSPCADEPGLGYVLLDEVLGSGVDEREIRIVSCHSVTKHTARSEYKALIVSARIIHAASELHCPVLYHFVHAAVVIHYPFQPEQPYPEAACPVSILVSEP